MKFGRAAAAAGASAVGGVALWWRAHPSACPYSQRFWVQAPHPLITRARLREALAPSPGERILEVGPGTGYYSLPVAEWLGRDGSLEIFDPGETVIVTAVADFRSIHLWSQPLPAMEVDVNRKGKPGLQRHTHAAEHRMHPVVV